MAPDTPITWDILNAYVDGELDRAMLAHVAAAAAHDAELAAKIATLARLKANFAEPDSTSFQAPLPALPFERPHRFARSAAIAACIASVLFFGILTLRLFGQKTPNDEWLSSALDAQRRWTSTLPENGYTDRSAVKIDAAIAARSIDLADAGLKLVYAATISPLAGNEITFLGYRGSHGCRIGLWIGAPQKSFGVAPENFDVGEIQVRAWRHHSIGYALLSGGMDTIRFDHLAVALSQFTDPGHIGDDRVRASLAEVGQIGTSCRV